MSIPTQAEMTLRVLDLMSDGAQRTRKQAKCDICALLALSEDEQAQVTSSGVRVYESRVGWAISYLSRAGMLQHHAGGVYSISSFGRASLASFPDPKDLAREVRSTITENNPWKSKDTEPSASDNGPASDSDEISPQEQIDRAFSQLDEELRKTLLDAILERDSAFFEKLVVDLLVKIGYGEGERTQLTSDNGIDGIIATDALGFDPIYVQAKRYAPDHSVGRPEVQGFAGALGSITRGAFITTSSFTKSAREWARHYPHATLVLVDGDRLTKLMIQHDLGVSTERTYRMKHIDADYFGED